MLRQLNAETSANFSRQWEIAQQETQRLFTEHQEAQIVKGGVVERTGTAGYSFRNKNGDIKFTIDF